MKLAIVGAGNAACITALSYHLHGQIRSDKIKEIEIYYDPNIPIERVGQGSVPLIAKIISQVLGVNYYDKDNLIKATVKNGALYENWGKNTPKHMHPFLMSDMSIHYSPHLLSKAVLESGLFKVVEKNIDDPESQIDSDFIFDCRGRNNRDKKLYRELINPLNAVILSNKKGKDPDLLYTKSVATPNGWTFIIPNHDSVSYGYLYNQNITSKEFAEKDFIDRFDVVPDGYLNFENYIAKDMFVGERTILNGNKLSFLEPLEATATAFYDTVSGFSWSIVADFELSKKNICNNLVQREMNKIQNFVLWHYAIGSAYDTPFWDYAQKLSANTFINDEEFNKVLEYSRNHSRCELWDHEYNYSQWHVNSIKNWDMVK